MPASRKPLIRTNGIVSREFIYDDEPMGSFGELEDVKDRVILVDSVSKRFSACGARVGSIICRNKEFMAEALKLCQGRLCSATIDQVGAAAMYRSVTPDYFKAVRDEYKKRRDTVVEELGKLPGVKFDVPDGAFYMWKSNSIFCWRNLRTTARL